MLPRDYSQKKIGWITTSSKKSGGNIYGEKVRNFLSEISDLEVKNFCSSLIRIRYLKPLEWIFNFAKLKGRKDLWIMPSFLDLIFASFFSRIEGKKIILIHHIDNSIFPIFLRPLFFFLEKVFYYNLRKADAVVVVSDYWKKFFLDKKYSNVYKIYNVFNLSEFDIPDEEVEKFKEKYNLERKPVIYLGNCQKAKGVVEAYQVLKDIDAYLVTSGEERVRIPALNLNLNYKDYLKLLKSSSVVLAMSKFKEGWNITAHEAMLVKTPVIGSGRGGMKELLEGGKQIICPNFKCLKREVIYLLKHPEARKKIGESGYKFARKFTTKEFENDWLNLIEKLLRQK